jgi:hypothetical protein
MGRPALRKKGPMTPAERQRRRRRKLRREKREAEMMAEREKNAARYRAKIRHASRGMRRPQQGTTQIARNGSRRMGARRCQTRTALPTNSRDRLTNTSPKSRDCRSTTCGRPSTAGSARADRKNHVWQSAITWRRAAEGKPAQQAARGIAARQDKPDLACRRGGALEGPCGNLPARRWRRPACRDRDC